MKNFIKIALLSAIFASTSLIANVANAQSSNRVTVCFTLTSPEGELLRARTVQLRPARAERVIAFYADNPIVGFTEGACPA